MPIKADQHMHTSFSFDSEAPMEDMVESSINKGLSHITFTEHNDFNYPVSENYPKGCWDLNVDSYLYDLLMLREKYEKKIEIGFGMELGLQPDACNKNTLLAFSQDYDFIIGSIHLVNKVDTYDEKFNSKKPVENTINEYLDEVIKNITKFKEFDVLGHLDYLTRVLPGREDDYNPSLYMDKISEILSILIKDGKGLELNTQTLGKGYKYANPWPEVLKRYKDLGGEIVTVGSDAHSPAVIAAGFDKAEGFLKDCGFNYYTVFHHRVPTNIKL